MNQLSFLDHLKTPRTARGRKTQAKIIQAAEIEFGERGYHEASITSITQRAKVALGTFYVYFESKEELFRALVIYMGKLARATIAEKIGKAPDRITAERRGIEAFIEFTRANKNNYRIIGEAQFVAEDAYREYYRVFAEAYRDNLKMSAEKGEIEAGHEEERAWALIGMNVFLGMNYGLWDETKSASEIAAAVGDLITYGLKGSKGS
ncbi:TetR/AcrR family transcriptional regulator [Kordiimonas lipolytica]|uniref:TetR/AcrR family transcriptional regulator n=1 Tax=Kordiimonas lipolytica TaxID=1662421 RepID=A0ABV8UAP6_9PROT|nr:TetR/AcrR family transcriptional regulator [Kordiimonas lipolytica]